MKKTKRILALLLGCLMLLGCISVSAADSLVVTEKPAKMIYENDFSGETVDEDHIVLGANASQSNGAIRSTYDAGHVVTFNISKELVTVPVTFEFDVFEYNMKDVGNAQIQMFFLNKAGSIVGDLRWYNANPMYFTTILSTGSQSGKKVENDDQSAHVKVKLNPQTNSFAAWIDGHELISEEEGPAYAKMADFSDVAAVKINTSQPNMSVVLTNLKIYTEESAGVPAIWEEVYRQDFEKTVDTFTATSNEIVPEINANVTTTQKNGVLTMKTSKAGAGTKVYLQPNKEALTGKYVVEMVLKNSSQTTANNGYHRITFGGLSSYYLHWLPSKVLKFRLVGSNYSDLTSRMAEFNANGDTLKVTMCFDTETYKLTMYYNDIFAFEQSYADDANKVERTSFAYINFNLYNGQIDLADLRVYRPLEIDENTGIKIEEKGNKVRFAVNNEKSGNIYFAKYDVEDTSKSLASIGTAGVNFVPGKIYTVDKTDWDGAKAFLWDDNLAPIVNPWDLSQAE